jgi:hypothetical protein
MEHFTGEFNNHKTDVKLMSEGWRILVDDQLMKNGPFKDAKKAKNFCEERAQNVIHGLAQQNLQAQQHTNLLSQAA